MQTVDIINEIDKLTHRSIQSGRADRGRPSGTRVYKSADSFSPPAISQPTTLTKMNARHHEIVRLSILGYKEVDIAKRLEVTSASVKYCLNSPIAKMMIANINGARTVKTVELADQITEILPDAIKLMKNVIDGGTLDDKDVRDRALQVSTAKHLLGIGGLSPVKRVDARTQTTHLTAQDIKELVAEAKQLGMCVGGESEVIEADYTEEDSIDGEDADG